MASMFHTSKEAEFGSDHPGVAGERWVIMLKRYQAASNKEELEQIDYPRQKV